MNKAQQLTLGQIFRHATDRTHLAAALDGEGEWGCFMVKILIFLVGLSTLSFSLDSVDTLHAQHKELFLGIDLFCLLFFTIGNACHDNIIHHHLVAN